MVQYRVSWKRFNCGKHSVTVEGYCNNVFEESVMVSNQIGCVEGVHDILALPYLPGRFLLLADGRICGKAFLTDR